MLVVIPEFWTLEAGPFARLPVRLVKAFKALKRLRAVYGTTAFNSKVVDVNGILGRNC